MEFCNTCAYSDKIKKVCLYYGTHIDIDKDFCSKHAKEINYCEVCQQPMELMGSFLEQDSKGVWHQYCARCAELLKTCQACSAPCEFATNPDPMPKVVMKTVRQGNMVMQTQVKNEERVQKFCPSCCCWDENHGCMKEFNVGCINKQDFWTSRNPS